MMNPPAASFPMLIAYEILYMEAGQIFHLFGNKQRLQLTEEEYNQKLTEFHSNNIQYMLLYDYMFVFKKDKWDANPTSIDIDEIEFYYNLSILNEEDFMKLKYLYMEYRKPDR